MDNRIAAPAFGVDIPVIFRCRHAFGAGHRANQVVHTRRTWAAVRQYHLHMFAQWMVLRPILVRAFGYRVVHFFQPRGGSEERAGPPGDKNDGCGMTGV